MTAPEPSVHGDARNPLAVHGHQPRLFEPSTDYSHGKNPHATKGATMTATLPHECNSCHGRWGGFNTAHCAGCHRTFTGLSAFDKHRDGSHADDTRHCLEPSEVGLVDANRAYACWGWPSDGNDRWSEDAS